MMGRYNAVASIFALTILVGATLLILAGCGGSSRHSTGIYAPPVPESESGQPGTPVRPAYNPVTTQHTIGGSAVKIPEYVLHPDVQAVFINFQPVRKTTVIEPYVDISAKLQITDYREERWSRLDNLRIEMLQVNGIEESAALYKLDDGFEVRLDGYALDMA